MQRDGFLVRKQLAKILEDVRNKNQASLEVKIEGKAYVRNFKPRERLIVLGAGNIGQRIGEYAASVGFSVIVVDDRPSFANQIRFPTADEIYCEDFVSAIQKIDIGSLDYVTIVTRGHRHDMECLRTILGKKTPHYLGMMASKRRAIGILDLLRQDGVEETVLEQIYMPIGLSIGAVTPEEIGFSIVAELISCRRKDTPRRSGSTVMTCEDIDRSFIEFLEKDKSAKAVLMVYETSGSTPVKSGAIMAVNQNFQIAGTIGGGCTEAAVMREAFYLIGTGKSKTLTLDMSNDVAAEAGMACGGIMKVWISDISE